MDFLVLCRFLILQILWLPRRCFAGIRYVISSSRFRPFGYVYRGTTKKRRNLPRRCRAAGELLHRRDDRHERNNSPLRIYEARKILVAVARFQLC